MIRLPREINVCNVFFITLILLFNQDVKGKSFFPVIKVPSLDTIPNKIDSAKVEFLKNVEAQAIALINQGEVEIGLSSYRGLVRTKKRFYGGESIEYATALIDIGGLYSIKVGSKESNKHALRCFLESKQIFEKNGFSKTYYHDYVSLLSQLLITKLFLEEISGLYEIYAEIKLASELITISTENPKCSEAYSVYYSRLALMIFNVFTGEIQNSKIYYEEIRKINDFQNSKSIGDCLEEVEVIEKVSSLFGIYFDENYFKNSADSISNTQGFKNLGRGHVYSFFGYRKKEGKALELLFEKRFPEAIKILMELLREATVNSWKSSEISSLRFLGLAYSVSMPDSAEFYFQQALIRSKTYHGEKSFFFSELQYDFAYFYIESNNYEEGIRMYGECLNNTVFHINEILPFLSQEDRINYTQKIRYRLGRFAKFMLTLEMIKDMPSVYDERFLVGNEVLYNLSLVLKSLTANFNSKIANYLNRTSEPHLRKEYTRWKDLKQKLANIIFESLPEDNYHVRKLISEIENIESKISTEFKFFDFEKPNWELVKNNLKDNECAIEILKFEYSKKSHYICLVIPSHSAKYPELINLQSEEIIEDVGYQNYLLSRRTKNEESFNIIWKPIQNVIGSNQKVYFSPDGIYNLVNLDILTFPNGRYLGDSISITTVNSTRDILTSINEKKEVHLHSSTSQAVMIGNPIWDKNCFPNLDPLPSKEIDVSVEIFESANWIVSLFTGKDATEDILNFSNSPDILHVSSHGFFGDIISENCSIIFNELIDYPRLTSMFKSGLILTGAGFNTKKKLNSLSSDGLLTAYEVSNLNLSNTKLTVLSACGTGTGDIVDGEGVFGLKRAIQIAGTDNIIVSLWDVKSEFTSFFFERFYNNLLIEKMNIKDAFNIAQAELKKRSDYPYEWGGLILIGTGKSSL